MLNAPTHGLCFVEDRRESSLRIGILDEVLRRLLVSSSVTRYGRCAVQNVV
jgi:hypothetical protein